MAKISSNAKTKVYVGTVLVDHTADVYAEISGAAAFTPSGAIGGEQDIKTLDLLSGEHQIGGLVRNGTIEITMATDHSDSGQNALEAARHDDLSYNFKIEKPDMPDGGTNGTLYYIKARVTAFGETSISGSESESMSTAKLAVVSWSNRIAAV